MTTINQVRRNVIARKEKAEAERIARELATANSVELLLERANTNAGRALTLAAILEPINHALGLIAVADVTNQDITLEQAGSMHRAFDAFDKTFASIFDVIDNEVLGDAGEEDEPCECCANVGAAEDIVIEVPAGTNPEDLVKSLLRMTSQQRPH